MEITLTAIGRVASPHRTKHEAPRQASVGAEIEGRIELDARAEFEHALEGLDAFTHLWVLSYLDRVEGWKPKVQPPRSTAKRGVFATRAPRRPNPIGMSLVKLERIEGTTLYVTGLDLLDGTPVLDLKPHLPYADTAPDANSGWLSETPALDPGPRYSVDWTPEAERRLAWLIAHGGPDLRAPVSETLKLGPTPHAYRRIKRHDDGYRLAYRDFRFDFRLTADRISVLDVRTGYKPSVLADPTAPPTAATPLEVHRRFAAAFP